MKKSLVLAMAMALGVTASAYAANPFSDVPAGHWAYDSISKLAAAGVIEGYGDDTFRGDRLMTRYEMAQIVAKAMAKGANVNKLAAEFADELDALGVRVAALEKKSDNVRITGQVRYRWMLATPQTFAEGGNGGRARHSKMRTRLWINGQINDTWKYVARLQNENDFISDNAGGNDQATVWHLGYVTGRIGGVRVEGGRQQVDLFSGDSDIYSGRSDWMKGEYGDKVKIGFWYGKPTALNGANGPWSKFIGAKLSYDADKWGAFIEYDKFSTSNRNPNPALGQGTRDIWGIGANGKFGDFTLTGLFTHGKTSGVAGGKKNGWTLEAAYKGAVAAKPGTWGISAKYYDQGNHSFFEDCGAIGMDAMHVADPAGRNSLGNNGATLGPDGLRGFRVKANYTFAKNIVGTLHYYDMKGKGQGGRKEKTAIADVVFTF